MLNRYHGGRGALHPRQRRHDRAVRRRRAAGAVQRAGPAGRPRPRAVRAALAMQAAVRGDRRRPSRTGRGSGSAPTPARRWSATSAARPCAASTRWATRSTWRPGCRRVAEPGQVVIGEATLDALGDGGHGDPARRPRGEGPAAAGPGLCGGLTLSRMRLTVASATGRVLGPARPPSEAAALEAAGRPPGVAARRGHLPRGRRLRLGGRAASRPGQGLRRTPRAAPRSSSRCAGPGRCSASSSAIDREPRSATVTAIEPVDRARRTAPRSSATCRPTAGSPCC